MLESVDWGAVCLERPVLIEPLDKCLGGIGDYFGLPDPVVCLVRMFKEKV